jgi:hypothetical protein
MCIVKIEKSKESKESKKSEKIKESKKNEKGEKVQRGGWRKNSGRKAEDGATGLIRVSITLTPEHRDRFKVLGGSLWLRRMIDEKWDAGSGRWGRELT